ncbi:MAG TPA: hypothetical protein VKX33_14335 [Cyclobacteriaceae bacterium]|nr:hypothetical protein [Cyclobacteriaceae bacterium]
MIMRAPFFENLFVVGLIYVLTLYFSHSSYAQLSKEEKRNWKKEIKKLTPEGMKFLMEERQRLTSVLRILNNESAQLKSRAFEQDQEVAFLKSELQESHERLKTREIQLGLINENGERWDSGVVFKVQIGALTDRDFLEVQERSYALEVERNKNYRQYVIGNFRNYHEADLLKKHMRKVGMTKAWIVPYKNGRRVALKDVLDVVTAP